ncbi:DUF3995 domain-containing protein [Deinococcus psychrotolerans]|uniref:DUF3995 domain-containing protein n=1 Tax=Deinococcus psychrotolerans TaxID=2489213 RepID=A0A3G8Y9F3_9DEIO|nr:DUF3995 domain-containing protein [Deinococcus psychrotolerans]AZI41570.1 DUF3995 domain-containing protein [Deinococcus psychrotolerans]
MEIISVGLLTLVLLSIASVHVYWGLGGVWPGKDPQSLARTVVGGPAGMSPPPAWACFGVALALALAAGMVLAFVDVLTLPLPTGWLRWGMVALAVVFLLRGVGGYFMERLRPSPVGSPFVRLNKRIYSPLCIVLGLLAWTLMRSQNV